MPEGAICKIVHNSFNAKVFSVQGTRPNNMFKHTLKPVILVFI